MSELIRDTVVGHFLRVISRGKLLPYAEDRDPSLWKKYINIEKSNQMAKHGHTGQETPEEQQERSERLNSSSTSTTRLGSESEPTNLGGARIDQEKGRDVHVVDWYGEKDPEVGGKRYPIRDDVLTGI